MWKRDYRQRKKAITQDAKVAEAIVEAAYKRSHLLRMFFSRPEQ